VLYSIQQYLPIEILVASSFYFFALFQKHISLYHKKLKTRIFFQKIEAKTNDASGSVKHRGLF